MKPTRRSFIIGSTAAVAAAATAELIDLEGSPAMSATVPFLPYTADSFFKSRVETAPIDSARTSAFHTFMSTFVDQKAVTWPKVNMNANWAMSYAVSDANDPIWKLNGTALSNTRVAFLHTVGFHMPDSMAATFPTGTQDRPGTVVDTAGGFTTLFADAVPDLATRTIQVSAAGVMWHTSNGLDYRDPATTDTRNFVSRGRIPDAMVLRRDLLDAAVTNGTGLGHVLHIYLAETKTADGFCHPMIGCENGQYGFGAEGERMRINPGVNLAGRGLTGAALAVARTLKEHGAYIGDNSGSSTQIKAAQAGVYTGTNLTTDCLKGKVAWKDFQMVQRGWQ